MLRKCSLTSLAIDFTFDQLLPKTATSAATTTSCEKFSFQGKNKAFPNRLIVSFIEKLFSFSFSNDRCYFQLIIDSSLRNKAKGKSLDGVS